MTYQKQAWVSKETVVSAARMDHIENGIEAAHSTADAAQAAADAAPQVQAGRALITPTANTPTSVDVTFPQTFRSEPEMTASALSAAPGTVVEVTVDAITTTGARIWMNRASSTATSVSWIAVAV